MENYIPISFLNDFIFCPRSIYFHQVYGNVEQEMYHCHIQIEGKAAHSSIEKRFYSTRKDVLMGIDVYCEKYNIVGKIDIYDISAKKLVERKNRIVKIYDGFIFQLYAQTFALREMGYEVEHIALYDKTHNIMHPVNLPENDILMFQKFEKLIQDINSFSLTNKDFRPNENKCKTCIYSQLCDYSI